MRSRPARTSSPGASSRTACRPWRRSHPPAPAGARIGIDLPRSRSDRGSAWSACRCDSITMSTRSSVSLATAGPTRTNGPIRSRITGSVSSCMPSSSSSAVAWPSQVIAALARGTPRDDPYRAPDVTCSPRQRRTVLPHPPNGMTSTASPHPPPIHHRPPRPDLAHLILDVGQVEPAHQPADFHRRTVCALRARQASCPPGSRCSRRNRWGRDGDGDAAASANDCPLVLFRSGDAASPMRSLQRLAFWSRSIISLDDPGTKASVLDRRVSRRFRCNFPPRWRRACTGGVWVPALLRASVVSSSLREDDDDPE